MSISDFFLIKRQSQLNSFKDKKSSLIWFIKIWTSSKGWWVISDFVKKRTPGNLKKGKFAPLYLASGFKDEAENLPDLFVCHKQHPIKNSIFRRWSTKICCIWVEWPYGQQPMRKTTHLFWLEWCQYTFLGFLLSLFVIEMEGSNFFLRNVLLSYTTLA